MTGAPSAANALNRDVHTISSSVRATKVVVVTATWTIANAHVALGTNGARNESFLMIVSGSLCKCQSRLSEGIYL